MNALIVLWFFGIGGFCVDDSGFDHPRSDQDDHVTGSRTGSRKAIEVMNTNTIDAILEAPDAVTW
jgi:hypothetical protein